MRVDIPCAGRQLHKTKPNRVEHTSFVVIGYINIQYLRVPFAKATEIFPNKAKPETEISENNMLQRPRRRCEGTAMGAIVLDLRPGLGIGPFSLGISFSIFCLFNLYL